MDTLASIKAFRQVVESGSFVAAAERLHLSTAMVSKHVIRTEQRLGVRLLNRNSRTLSLTEAGRVYFERCKSVLDDLQATELELGSLSSAPRGTLRVTAPSFATCLRPADLLARFRDRYPEVVIDVSFEDRIVDLVDEGCDVALRVASDPDCLPLNVIARPIRPTTFYLAASREYVRRRGVPECPEELASHDYVAAGNLNALRLSGANGEVEIPLRVALRCSSMLGAANAIAAGIGIGTVPETLLEESPYKDVLTSVLAECPLPRAMLHIVYVSRKFVPPKVRAFVDFVVGSLASIPESKPIRRPRTENSETQWRLDSGSNATLPQPSPVT